MLDEELVKIADDWAEKMIQDIWTAINNPEVGLEGDALKYFQLLKDWEWFNECPLDSVEGEMITRKFLTIQKYQKLKWAKEHPPVDKPSKWDIVIGKAGRRRKK